MKTLLRSRLVLGTAFLSLLGAVTYACKDFLNTPSQGTVASENLLNRAGVEGSLIAAYRMLDCNSFTAAWGCAGSNWSFGDITSDDAYKGSEATDQPQATQVELYAWGTDQAGQYLEGKWQTVYEGIVRANNTLRLLARVKTENPQEIPAGDASSIEGEAKFLRAHYHFEAYRMWGSIPYYHEDDTDPLTGKANLLPNVSPDSASKLIIADLNAAAALLPATARNGEAGRATAWTARAYKGRVFAYRGQWDSALVVLRAVQASNVYALEASFDRVWTGFSQFKNGKETIWAYEASTNDGEPNGQNGNWGETLNFPHSGSPFGCCGFHQPSQNLANAYAVDAITGLPKAFTGPGTFNNRDSTWVAAVTDTVDPRLDWTIGRDNVPFKDWGLHRATWIRAPGYGGRYSPKKNVQENGSGSQSQVGWNAAQLNSVHYHLYRYADALLLLAEAEVQAPGAGGTIANALAIVNQIRTRAGVKAQGCGGGVNHAADSVLEARYPTCVGHKGEIAVPINDPTIKWATYKVGLYTLADWPDAATALRAIRLERRLELGMEGQRLFDLRRYGVAEAQSTMTAYLTKELTRRTYKLAQTPYETKHQLFPIPQIEIDLSKQGGTSVLTQNTGW